MVFKTPRRTGELARAAWAAIALILLAVTTGAHGQADEGVFNKLLAPGPLIKDHANLEHGQCLKCHDPGAGVPDKNCLACHTAIKNSIATGKSFHAKVKEPCIACHTDHKGRNFDSTKVNTKGFNHNQTGFPLRGKHATVDCFLCHVEKKNGSTRFFGTSPSCIGCHKKDDPHAFKGRFAKMECSECHSETSWKNARFDHAAMTGYPLIGHHAKLPCADCHTPRGKASAKYDFPELKTKQCLTCHDDFHKGKLGPKFSGGACDQCHSQNTWTGVKFDHAKTGFPLRGKHASLTCSTCHADGKAIATKHLDFRGRSSQCVSCHADYHGFRGERADRMNVKLTDCQTCHNESTWKATKFFNHNTHTDFPIDGRHVGVACFSCHTTVHGNRKGGPANVERRYDFPQLAVKTCETCHKSPHPNDPGSVFRTQKCTACHTTAGWHVFAATKGFNHNTMTAFPLTGDHAGLSCKSCHLKNGKEVFKFPNKDKGFCVSCHTNVHKDQFNPKFAEASCATCHNTTDFANLTAFDHNTTRFKLTGSHAKLASNCVSCHVPTKKKLPTKPPKTAHKFRFEGADVGFCSSCHQDVHAAIKPPQFSERFPTKDCRACHNVVDFANLKTFNHDKTRFRIIGAHAKFGSDCSKCHVPTKKVLATKPPKPAGKFNFGFAEQGFCEACHTNVHKDQFSKKFSRMKCTECHNQSRFDRRRPFDHNKTDFKLTGAHLKIAKKCEECHVPTKKKLPTNPPKPAGKFQFSFQSRGFCEACHQNEHVGQFRTAIAKSPCRSCHTTVDFLKITKFDHSRARFDLHGKHKNVKCEECHVDTKVRYKTPPHNFKGRYFWSHLFRKDCALCHEDPHKGAFGEKCSSCHTEEGWLKTADFHRNNVLTGVHNLVSCGECHVEGKLLTGMGDDCKVCHQKDDVHLGSQPDCGECHTQLFWAASKFHHSMTGFPLRGVHRTLSCNDCHMGGVYHGMIGECAACHFEDAQKVTTPNHSLPGFENCEQCHNQFSFPGANK